MIACEDESKVGQQALDKMKLFSVQFENENYNWSTDPKAYIQTDKDKAENEIGLKDMRIVEIGMQGEIAMQLTVLHTIKVINSNEAIERNNKISVPYSNGSKIIQSNSLHLIILSVTKFTSYKNIKQKSDQLLRRGT